MQWRAFAEINFDTLNLNYWGPKRDFEEDAKKDVDDYNAKKPEVLAEVIDSNNKLWDSPHDDIE